MPLYLRRLAWFLCGTILIAVVAVAGLIFAFLLNFHASPPKTSYPVPASALDAQRQDLDYFGKVMRLDRSFSAAARAAAEAPLAALKSSNALPRPKLQVELMQMMAFADNGHSRVAPTTERDTLVLPLRVTSFAEGFYVMRATLPYRDLLGGRVDSIDGQTFGRILPKLETLRGGVEGFRRANAALFIIVQDLLYGLGIATDPESTTWTVTLPDGRAVTRHVQAYPLRKGDDLFDADRWLTPEPGKWGGRNWLAYRPLSGSVPETWRDPDNPFRNFPASGSCARVIRLKSIADTNGHALAPFLAMTERVLSAESPCAVIVDLRGDGGGDYTKIWHFAHALPKLLAPQGRIFILTDALTFSAAITTAAFIKEAGGDRVMIVGEPVGDRLSFFSEGGKACLPNLKVCAYYQTAKHDYAQPCTDWRECFWLNWLYPVRVKSLQPDVLVPLRFDDWDAGHDAAFLVARDMADRRAAN
jgi:hypothetical protein